MSAPANTALTADERAVLAALMGAPATVEARERAAKARADRRAAIVKELQRTEPVALAEAKREGDARNLAQKAVDEATAALHRAVVTRDTHGLASSIASERAERLRNRAAWELRELGGEAIDRAISVVRTAHHEARSRLGWVEKLNWRRDVVGMVPKDPTLEDFVARMHESARELEALRFSPLAPDAIVQRCEAAMAEATAREFVPPSDRQLLTPPVGV